MPASVIHGMVRQHGLTPKRAEYLWNGAKKLARKAGLNKSHGDRYWRYVNGVAQKMAARTKRKTMKGSKHTLEDIQTEDFLDLVEIALGIPVLSIEESADRLHAALHHLGWKHLPPSEGSQSTTRVYKKSRKGKTMLGRLAAGLRRVFSRDKDAAHVPIHHASKDRLVVGEIHVHHNAKRRKLFVHAPPGKLPPKASGKPVRRSASTNWLAGPWTKAPDGKREYRMIHGADGTTKREYRPL